VLQERKALFSHRERLLTLRGHRLTFLSVAVEV
jgi:hypothetical protein